MKPDRAWVLLPSGKRLDLLTPDPSAWTDRDLAISLSRTYRWGGHSRWELPLSVAQHSLLVLVMRQKMNALQPLSRSKALRELLHDAEEGFLCLGSAGCVLANRLTEDPDCRVLLIEAGGEATHRLAPVPGAMARLQDTTLDWGFRTTRQAHLFDRVIAYPRGRAVGGTSVLNYLLYIRGNRGDYDHWRQLGNAGWAYDDVLPYFKRAENNASIRNDFHGGNGPLHVESQPNPPPLCETFLEAAQSIGIPFNPDFNGASQEGCGYYQATLKNGRRCSTAVAYIEPACSRRNFHLVRDAIVTRLVVERERARGVEYIINGRVIERADADVEIICAAGAIGTPHLMMLSGLGPADHLAEHGIRVEADLRGVGRNLQDHLGSLGVRASVRDPDVAYGAGRGDFASALDQFERDGSGPLATNGVEAGAFLRADKKDADGDPNLQISLTRAPLNSFGPTALRIETIFTWATRCAARRVGDP